MQKVLSDASVRTENNAGAAVLAAEAYAPWYG